MFIYDLSNLKLPKCLGLYSFHCLKQSTTSSTEKLNIRLFGIEEALAK